MIYALSIAAGLALLYMVWRFVAMELWLRRMRRNFPFAFVREHDLRRELRAKLANQQTPNQERTVMPEIMTTNDGRPMRKRIDAVHSGGACVASETVSVTQRPKFFDPAK